MHHKHIHIKMFLQVTCKLCKYIFKLWGAGVFGARERVKLISNDGKCGKQGKRIFVKIRGGSYYEDVSGWEGGCGKASKGGEDSNRCH